MTTFNKKDLIDEVCIKVKLWYNYINGLKI